jgi:hypothetical protein
MNTKNALNLLSEQGEIVRTEFIDDEFEARKRMNREVKLSLKTGFGKKYVSRMRLNRKMKLS